MLIGLLRIFYNWCGNDAIIGAAKDRLKEAGWKTYSVRVEKVVRAKPSCQCGSWYLVAVDAKYHRKCSNWHDAKVWRLDVGVCPYCLTVRTHVSAAKGIGAREAS